MPHPCPEAGGSHVISRVLTTVTAVNTGRHVLGQHVLQMAVVESQYLVEQLRRRVPIHRWAFALFEGSVALTMCGQT